MKTVIKWSINFVYEDENLSDDGNSSDSSEQSSVSTHEVEIDYDKLFCDYEKLRNTILHNMSRSSNHNISVFTFHEEENDDCCEILENNEKDVKWVQLSPRIDGITEIFGNYSAKYIHDILNDGVQNQNYIVTISSYNNSHSEILDFHKECKNNTAEYVVIKTQNVKIFNKIYEHEPEDSDYC
jgi:hypothetical protein